jgi:hypothetical protein
MQYLKLEVSDLAAEQWGMVTAAQARVRGESLRTLGRLAQQGTLERMAHGVYRLSSNPSSPLDDLRAAWLSLDPEHTATQRVCQQLVSVVSHRSAAKVHGLGDLDADVYEFTSAERKQSRRGDVRFSKAELHSDEWTLVDGLPVTTVPRTISDLAKKHTDGGHLATVVRDALVTLNFDDQLIINALNAYAHHYGIARGNGKKLFIRFLRETGLPDLIHHSVLQQLETQPSPDPATTAMQGPLNSDQAQRIALIITEMLTVKQRVVEKIPPARIEHRNHAGREHTDDY